jgi:murein DD-endopeptidase MepM/ murein hydrolase activator NlpD
MATDDQGSDTSGDRAADTYASVADRVARAATRQRSRVLSDGNARVPQPEYAKDLHRYVYETAPVTLKRLFASPLALKGKYAKGPHHERIVTAGWGAPRPTGFHPSTDATMRHSGLDYTAPWGERVYAAAAGKVVFVGYQTRKHGDKSVAGVHQSLDHLKILDGDGDVVAQRGNDTIGLGGIMVKIKHHGDFRGYQTLYLHLSQTDNKVPVVPVKEGDEVEEGDWIGNVGTTGSTRGPHLHFQVSYIAGGANAIVVPTYLVPNYWPGHEDTSQEKQGIFNLPVRGPVGTQVAVGRAMSVVTGVDRATAMQNMGVSDVKNAQSAYAQRTAQVLDVQRTSVYAATAAFQGASPVVTTPMSFDFSKGVWVVGDTEDGAV